MGANPSLTPHTDSPTFTGGRVVVYGRGDAPPVIASVDAGINWTEAAKEKVLILPETAEWAALAAKAGV